MSDKDKQVPKLRFKGFEDSWEQRKVDEKVKSVDTGKSKYIIHSNGKYAILGSTSVIGYDDTYDYEGDFLLTARVGANAGTLYRHLGKVKITDNTVFLQGDNLDFLYYQLLNFDLHKLSFGTGQPLVKASELKELYLAMPNNKQEIEKIGSFFCRIDNAITLHQRRLEKLKTVKNALLKKMFPDGKSDKPELRFSEFTDSWEQRKLSTVFRRVNERNDGTYGVDSWISVAKMYFQDPEKVQSNNLLTRTYVMKFGDMAFEGHPNSVFKYGRFVVNDIGNGIISELFPIYRHIEEYDNQFWKNYIQMERVMVPIYERAITQSYNSSNKLTKEHFLSQSLYVPKIKEQMNIGQLFSQLDNTITLHQQKIEKLQKIKSGLLQKMFP